MRDVNKKQRISIIVPMYNAEKYIERCIYSIQKQTYKNFEVLLVDDGSKDDTVKICKKLIGNDSRFILIHKENTGVSDSRNIGINKAQGDFITFIDSDDWVEPNYLSFLLELTLKYQVLISCCGIYENYENRQIRKKFFAEKVLDRQQALDVFSDYYFTAIWGKLYRKELFKSERFDLDLTYSEDTLLYCKLVYIADKICWSSEPLYHYYINEKGAIKRKDPEKYYSDFLARGRISKYLINDKNLYSGALIKQMESAIHVKLLFYVTGYDNKEYEKKIDEFIDFEKKHFICCKQVALREKILFIVVKYKILLKLYKVYKNVK